MSGDRWIPLINDQQCGKCFHVIASSWLTSLMALVTTCCVVSVCRCACHRGREQHRAMDHRGHGRGLHPHHLHRHHVLPLLQVNTAGPWFNIKMSPYQYRKSHCGDKTVVRSSYHHNGISCVGKMAFLYWISPEVVGFFFQTHWSLGDFNGILGNNPQLISVNDG